MTSDSRWSDLARQKAEIIKPLLGQRPLPANLLAAACRAAGTLFGSANGGVSHQTIRNWIADYEREGLDGLERKARSTKGLTTLDPKLSEAIRGWILSPKCYSLAKVHRLAIRYARTVLKVPDDALPSYKQIRYIDRQIPLGEKLLAHQGVRVYRATNEMHVRFEALHANHIWQMDHHQLDIIVVDPQTGEELKRPWITTVEDDYSRAICGYYLSLDNPSSTSIALALRHAMLPKADPRWPAHGIPQVLYIDNGKDFSSRHIEDVALHFNIDLHFHEPYHPQSKGKIERMFRTLEEMCIHDLDGYVGSNPQKRPHNVTPSLTLMEVGAEVDQCIGDYHDRRHGTTKVKPRDRWLDDTRVIRVVEHVDDLDFLLMSKLKKVRKDGIHFKNTIYLDQDGVLQQYIGMWVTIFYNPRDYNTIRVYIRDQEVAKYICTAVAQTEPNARVSATELAQQNSQRRRSLLKKVREHQRQGNAALHELEQAETPLAISETTLPAQPPVIRLGSVLQEPEISDEPSEADLAALRRKLRYRYKA